MVFFFNLRKLISNFNNLYSILEGEREIKKKVLNIKKCIETAKFIVGTTINKYTSSVDHQPLPAIKHTTWQVETQLNVRACE